MSQFHFEKIDPLSINKLQHPYKDVNSEDFFLSLQERLEEMKVLLHHVLHHIHQGILFVNKEKIISYANTFAEKILEKASLVGKNYLEIFSDEHFGFSIQKNLEFGLSPTLQYLTFEGKEIEVFALSPKELPKSREGILFFLRDTTQLKELQRTSSHTERLKALGEMAATIAHEVRNPLGGIRGYASLLYRDLENSKHLQDMASQIIEGTKLLERTVNHVLQYARPVNLQISSVNLASFLREITSFIKMDPSFPDNVSLELHISQDPLFAPLDKDLFRSALLNLLVNAFQAIENEGKIIVSLLKNNNSGILTISDTGKGISESDVQHLFSPFFTTKQKGTGLGLAEAHKIIQAHLGTIDVRSRINVGTTFTITLPLRR
ncbi:MAG: ATP-binding protein [Chlamydiota bacterium]